MVPPSTADFVTTIPYHQVAIYDVSHLLPRFPGKHYNSREKPIQQIFVHKSGANGPPGFRGYQACATFCVNYRQWPGVPYHFWLAQMPDIDVKGNLVIYQGQPENIVSWHTGGANTWSVGIGVQGNYDGEWDLVDGLPQINRQPTKNQMTMLDALVDYLLKKYQLPLKPANRYPTLSGHWEGPRPKAVCPGDALRQWILEKRGTPKPPPLPVVHNPPLDSSAISFTTAQTWPIRDLQQALELLGFSPGKIDGIFGYKTRKAVERFQRHNKLVVDGWVGRRTALKLQKRLLDKGIHTVHAMRKLNP